MDSKKLEILVTAADLGSFTKTSEVVGYTQSGLTHMMDALEREIGFPLLQRSHSRSLDRLRCGKIRLAQGQHDAARYFLRHIGIYTDTAAAQRSCRGEGSRTGRFRYYSLKSGAVTHGCKDFVIRNADRCAV